MDHPDFRVAGKIFATLGYPDENWGMVKFTPQQQIDFLKKAPTAFSPCNGAWGRRGATSVHLASARVPLVRVALKAAWENLTANGKRREAASGAIKLRN